MKTIWKFEAAIADTIIIEMPSGAKILSVASQKLGAICFWAVVESDARKEERHFQVRGTGHLLGSVNSGRFIGTVIDGRFVWHVFEA